MAGLLPAPGTIHAAVTLTDANGAPLAGAGPVPVTVDQLGIGPLDLLDLAARPAELAQLAVHTVVTARAGAAPAAAGGTMSADPAADGTPLAFVLDIAGRLAAALAASRAADARDLALPGTSGDPGIDAAELAGRAAGALADLTAADSAFAQAFPAARVPPPGSAAPPPATLPVTAGAAAFTQALMAAALLGVPGAVPASTGGDDIALQALAGQAYAAWTELARRQAAAAAATLPQPSPVQTGTGPTPPQPSPVQQLDAGLAQLAAVFGPAFPAMPQLPAAGQTLAAASLPVPPASPGQDPVAWLVKATRIWPALPALHDALTAAEALGSGPPLDVRIAQLPAGQAGGWAGLPHGGNPPAAGTLSLELLGQPPAATGPAGALVVADWAETIPSSRETTAVSYHFDAPATQAPQTILVAVPADRSVPAWTYASLRDTVADTLTLARMRTADSTDLAAALGTEAWALPALYLADRPTFHDPAVTLDIQPPQTFLQVTQVASAETCVGTLIQGMPGELKITGTTLTGLPASQFVFTPAGITPKSWNSSPPDPVTGKVTGTLTVAVDTHAFTSPNSYSLRAGAGQTLPHVIGVSPRPLVTTCATTVISQQMTPSTAEITVYGQALGTATATLTAPGLISLSSPTPMVNRAETVASWTATIAASTYDPNPDFIDKNGRIVRIPPSPPRNVAVQLTLTVTLTGAGAQSPATFPITLDTIV